jgi:hypothetical protein
MSVAGPSSGTKNSALKKPSSNASAGTTRRDTSASSASRFAGSADGYSKRSKLFVPGYFTESVTPITVTAPRWEKPSSVTSSPWRTSSAR